MIPESVKKKINDAGKEFCKKPDSVPDFVLTADEYDLGALVAYNEGGKQGYYLASEEIEKKDQRIRDLEEGLRELLLMCEDEKKKLIEEAAKNYETLALVSSENMVWGIMSYKLKQLLSSSSSDGWIDCKERLPEDKRYVFVYCSVKGFQSTNYAITQYSKQYGFESASSVTHWQPLPKPPNTI